MEVIRAQADAARLRSAQHGALERLRPDKKPGGPPRRFALQARAARSRTDRTGTRPLADAKELLALVEKILSSFRVARPDSASSCGPEGAKGLTLLELLVVIVIIGLLAGFVAPRYFSQVGKSEVQVAKAQIDAFEKALDQYRLDTRRYPSAEHGLKALIERPANEPQWNGPYLRKA